MARGKSSSRSRSNASSAKSSGRSITRERSGPALTANHGLVGSGTILSPAGSGAYKPADIQNPPALAKSSGANAAGRLGAKRL